MSIHLQNVVYKHERRVRLVFDNTLAAGAFSTLSFYTFVNTNSVGVSPNPVALFAIAGNSSAVEIQLDSDLSQGGIYSVSAIGVPAIDSTVTDSTNVLPLYFSTTPILPNVESQNIDSGNVLYGVDLVWTGADFAEDGLGDLAEQSGITVYQLDMYRTLTSDGLPWDPTYGAHLTQYVDAPAPGSLTMKGSILKAVLADDRTKTADATISMVPQLSSDGSTTVVTVEVDLVAIGQESPMTLPVQVPST